MTDEKHASKLRTVTNKMIDGDRRRYYGPSIFGNDGEYKEDRWIELKEKKQMDKPENVAKSNAYELRMG